MKTTRGVMLRVAVAALAIGVALGVPSAAHAWWRGGVVFGFAPPLFLPPPVYYGPPPVYYPPPAAYSPEFAPQPAGQAGQACYAGPYVCPLETASPAGSPCSCPTDNNGRAGGRAG